MSNSRSIRVLLIEDDLVDQRAFERFVRDQHLRYEVTCANTIDQARLALAGHEFDVILADYRMGTETSLDVFPAVGSIPIIVVTGSGDEEVAARAMKAGAYDYLIKDHQRNYLTMLPVVIDNTIRRRGAESLAAEHARTLAAAQERERIARDLHDSLSQTLFSINALSEALARQNERVPAASSPLVQQLNHLSRIALSELRTLMVELRPKAVVENTLDTLLRQLIEARVKISGIDFKLDLAVGCRLPPEVQMGFYRVAQEAINNIVKHSGAGQAFVTLHQTDAGCEMIIIDMGKGFDPTSVPGGHYGVEIMRERAAEIGATLGIDSRANSGTHISLIWTQSDTQGAAEP